MRSIKTFLPVSVALLALMASVSSGLPTQEVKADGYTLHEPIIIENIETSPENPLVIEGYEITDPDGPGIQVREVDYVVIRNNYVHDCGINHSLAIKEQIEAGLGGANLAEMNTPFETGGILVFEAKHVEIYGNQVINNDYGIYVWGHRFRAEHVEIYDNTVADNHRAYFVQVNNGDNIDIHGNTITDNGLSLFMDNEAMDEAFARGEDYPDGRTQGISLHSCNRALIHDNTVINSLSDGIGVVCGELDFAEDIEIYGNTVLRNSEQGIWLVGVRNGSIHDNLINENRSREDVTGGSSGLYFDGDVIGFTVYGNEMAYNDMFGLTISASSENKFYENDIHHNGDGGICWTNTPYRPQGISCNNLVYENAIHNNRLTAFRLWTDMIEDNTIDGNTLYQNGGQPIHYEMYEDHDVTAHPEDWIYNGANVGIMTTNEQYLERLVIGTNTIDDLPVAGNLNPAENTVPSTTPPQTSPTNTTSKSKKTTSSNVNLPVNNDTPENEDETRLEEILIPALISIAILLVIVVSISMIRRRRNS